MLALLPVVRRRGFLDEPGRQRVEVRVAGVAGRALVVGVALLALDRPMVVADGDRPSDADGSTTGGE